jgi:DNA repair ATPase RecN
MYRHLAHAPAFLQRVEAVLAPVQADGSLDRAIAANRATAYEAAKRLAQAISAKRPPLAAEIETGVSAFVDHAIGKMVTICRAIRVARGRPL